MWSLFTSGKPARPRAGRESRRAARFGVEGMKSPFGDVADISEGGVRVRCDKKPSVPVGATMRFWLRSGKHSLAVVGRVTRVRRRGWSKFEVGIQLVHESPASAKALVTLARFGFLPKAAEEEAAASGAAKNTGAARPAPPKAKLPNHYATLGVPIDAGADHIRRAYRALALELHPDLNHDPAANERFILVRQAYEVLRDADAKSRYDALAQRVFAKPSARA
jgi:hypothetical protein